MENNRSFYNEILTDHNLHPMHKHELADANMQLEGVNPSCGDDIILNLKVEDGKIVDGSFTGDGCAISQASADIMLDLIIGREVEEAERLKESFLHMIKGEATDEEMELLEEAGALADISHMPARVKCAVLGWHTLENMLDGRTEA
ncbi:MAG: SUF system NifU family Fe-S cluster assembly protein [Firmicutes bacterium CAG_194_44_15]|jgi:nitrogen fixation NifU-like protein|nr:MAG: SUF system NifU family Fe-S cluster assembly protein [Firmicutes bacterium CAG_194_44_15]